MKKSVQEKKAKELLHSADDVRKKLKVKLLHAENTLLKKHPKVKDFFQEKGFLLENIREHSAGILSAGILAGALFLAPQNDKLPVIDDLVKFIHKDQEADSHSNSPKLVSSNSLLATNLQSILPEKTRPLQRNEEKLLEQVLTQSTGIPVRATLEGEHLNTTYGRIGIEQHLRRYPGDTISNHGTLDEQREGMAPGLGAWGYFAPSKSALTEDLEEIEKWYAVVQTLYLPDWNTRQPYLKNWYKYRKVMIVNTENGNAVVASVADSGPAAWTGKHYGGSPEVMRHLGGESKRRYTKGPVLVFFVDDPENKVPLGPVNYDTVNIESNVLAQAQ